MTFSLRSFLGSASLLAACAFAMPPVVQAQTAASPAMTGTGADAGRMLTDAMARLARNPRDLASLIAAGEAALKLDDPRSAIGFFGRADDLSPNNGRVKAGLGRAMLAMGQNGDGLRLMEQAATLGYSDVPLLVDRALARDLSGNQAGAQRDYQEALQRDPQNDLAIRRYAVSLGISGQVDLAEKTIQPLLFKSDRAAWRDRAFILAMNGRTREALDITGKTMPPALADAIKPYMERMNLLTPGQRAAAVHMGQFPAGLVNVRVASTAVPAQQIAAATEAPAKKGRKASKVAASTQVATGPAPTVTAARRTPATAPQRVAMAPAASASVPARSPAPAPVQPPVTAQVVAAPVATVAPAAPAAQSPVSPLPVSQPPAASRVEGIPARVAAPAEPSAATTPATPRIDLRPATAAAVTPRVAEPSAVVASSTASAVQGLPVPVAEASRPASAPVPAPEAVVTPPASPPAAPAPAPAIAMAPAESTRTLADIMAEISIPEAERQQAVAPVNLAEIAAMQEVRRRQEAAELKARKAAEAKEAAKRKAEAEARAKADAEKKRLAANPARYWVQIGVGRDKGALAFTLKRMKKEHEALAKYDGWSADWVKTNRLVVGPFPTLAKAKAVEAEMKKGGSDAFVWRSEAGEEVDRIGG